MCAELGWPLFAGFTEGALETLRQHPWPGNVRELKNTVERSLFRWDDAESPVDEVVLDPFASPYPEAPEAAPPAVPASATAAEPADFHSRVRQWEIELLRSTLRANGNNQRLTAEALGLTYDQLRGMVRKYGLSGTGR